MANLSNINNKFIVTDGGDVMINNTIAGYPNGEGLTIKSSDNICRVVLQNSVSGGSVSDGFRIGLVNSNVEFESTESGEFQFYTGGGAAKMTIDSSGDVGIGTVVPQALLDVSKNNTTIYDPTDDLGQRTGTATIHITNQTATINTFGQLMYDSRSSGQGIARIVFLNGGPATVGIAFVTEHNDVKSEKMRISSNGNVGIGTDSPAVRLDFGNATGKAFHLYTSGTDYYGFNMLQYDSGPFSTNIIAGNGGDIKLRTASGTSTQSTRLTVKAAGDVGIGTTLPDSPLEIQNVPALGENKMMLHLDANHTGNTGSAFLQISAGTSSAAHTKIEMVSGGGQGLFGTYVDTNIINNATSSGAYGNINFITGSSTSASSIVMTIGGGSQKGKVGIGTTSPGHKLHVENTESASWTTRFSNTVADSNNIYFNYNNGTTSYGMYIDGGQGAAGYDIQTASGFVVRGDGKVGIGTVGPQALLTVSGSVLQNSNNPGIEVSNSHNSQTVLLINNTTSRKYELAVGGSANGVGNGSFYIYDATAGSSRFVVDSSGDIGIGTDSPSEKLTIPGNYGVGLGYKTFYSSGGTVPAGIGPSYYLVATLNQLQGTTLTSKHQYKVFLTTTGTGTYNSSVYIVYANSNDTAWQVREVSRRGTTSNHPELTVSGTEARIYNDHPSSYGVLYRVETTNSGQANTAPDIFGSDYMWQRTGSILSYTDGEVVISGATYSDGANNISLQEGLVKIGSGGTGSTVSMYFTNPNGVVGSVVTNGSNTQFNTSSDYRLKEDLQDFNGLDKVSKIPVYDFKWKVDESRSYGVIAHELQEVLPDAVSGEKDAEEMQGVDYSKIVPLLVKSIQELKAEIELLKSK